MSQDILGSFQRHLQVQGKRPGTQDRYVAILARFLQSVPVPEAAITADHVYDFLMERGTALGVSSSWYNVIFHALGARLTK